MKYATRFRSFNYQAKPTDLLNFACLSRLIHKEQHFFSNIAAIFNIMDYSLHIVGLTPVNCFLAVTYTPWGL